MAMKVKKGDRVVVLSGKDRGKRGEVIENLPREGRVVVRGVNIMTRHVKPSQADPQGGLKMVEAPLHVSKVALEDPKTGKPTRVGFRINGDGTKVRIAKRSGEVIHG
jgi:large subunit ribosomal protein L24